MFLSVWLHPRNFLFLCKFDLSWLLDDYFAYEGAALQGVNGETFTRRCLFNIVTSGWHPAA